MQGSHLLASRCVRKCLAYAYLFWIREKNGHPCSWGCTGKEYASFRCLCHHCSVELGWWKCPVPAPSGTVGTSSTWLSSTWDVRQRKWIFNLFNCNFFKYFCVASWYHIGQGRCRPLPPPTPDPAPASTRLHTHWQETDCPLLPLLCILLSLAFRPVGFFSVRLGVQHKAFSWLVFTGDHFVFHQASVLF